jgi:hypothetical protein
MSTGKCRASHRHVDAEAVAQCQRVGGGGGDVGIAEDGADAHQLGARIARQHQQRHGVIDAGVGVEQDAHAAAAHRVRGASATPRRWL